MSLKFGILGLLSDKDLTGYALKKEFDQSISHLWTASQSQIYRELNTLEKNELIFSRIEEQPDRPDKKIYTITPVGRTAFQEWLEAFPENLSSAKRDTFMLHMLFGSALPEETIRYQLHRFIEQKKAYLKLIEGVDLEAYYNDASRKELLDKRYMRFTLKRALMSLETLIEWAEWCLEEMKEDVK